MQSLSYQGVANPPALWMDLSSSGEYTPVKDGKSPRTPIQTSSKPQNFGGSTVHWRAVFTSLGAGILLLLASSFYIVTAARRNPTALPWPLASWLNRNATLSTLIITLISTILSMFSTYLFSSSIRYTMAISMSRSINLFMLGLSVRISNLSLFIYRDHLKWSLVGLAYLVATGWLTAGWSVLLTPTHILVQTPLTGRDLDLASPNYNKFFRDYPTDPGTDLDAIFLYSSSVDMSGVTGASGAGGFPLLLNFADKLYNVSTAGTNPAYIGVDDIFSLNRTGDALWSNETLPPGINSNFTMMQQGFTADVKCFVQELNETTTPSLIMFDQTTVIPDPGLVGSNSTGNVTLNSFRWMTMCGTEPVWSDTATSLGNNTFMGLGCSTPANGTNTFTLIIYGQGTYSSLAPPAVCYITPKITTVKVEYGTMVRTTIVNPLVTNDPGETLIMSQLAIGVLHRRFLQGQTLTGNNIGDALWGVIDNMNSTSFALEAFNFELLEGYITGVIEFSATMYRTGAFSTVTYAATHGEPDIVADIFSATTNNTGSYIVETLGYDHHFGVSILILLPLMCVSLATIGLILWAWFENIKSHRGRGYTYFNDANYIPELDVTDPFHLMAASSAGGMTGAFSGRPESFVRESNNIRVILRKNEVGFVQVKPGEALIFEPFQG